MGHFPAGGGGGGGSVDEITSDDDTVTITDPTGPTVDLSVEGGGGGWPDVDGNGSGNLIVITPDDDTVGYTFTDQGSGGIFLNSIGTGQARITSLAGILIENDGDGNVLKLQSGNGGASAGILLTAHDTDVGGITLDDSSVGGGLNVNSVNFISLDTEAGGESPPEGIEITTDPTDTGGIQIVDQGSGGVAAYAQGTGSITIQTTGGQATTGISIETQATDTSGISINDQGSGGITLVNGGSGVIAIVGLPDTDPGIPSALYQTAGAVMVSL